MNKTITYNKKTVSIGVTAYNAEKNIVPLVNSILAQRDTNYILEKIIIHSDASSDKTVAMVKAIKNRRIVVIDSHARIGFTKSFEKILKLSKSDVMVLLNDDIQIKDKNLISHLVQEFSASYVGLVSGNPQPLPPKTFIEKAAISSHNVYESMRNSMNNPHNVYTCDGKVLALSRKLIENLNIPSNAKNAGNLDCYLYFSTLQKGFSYRHAKSAIVYYRTPMTEHDYTSWTSRNNSNYFIMEKTFGSIVAKEFQKPLLYYFFLTREFIKNPLGSIYIKILGLKVAINAQKISKNFSPKWEVIATTKNLQ
jgi:glycosyltransferase involved in cell wall biosynthesis